MKKMEIDLPALPGYETLEVICKVNHNYTPKKSAEALLEFLGEMPLHTLRELYNSQQFREEYSAITNRII